jgi:hypothetical protein
MLCLPEIDKASSEDAAMWQRHMHGFRDTFAGLHKERDDELAVRQAEHCF